MHFDLAIVGSGAAAFSAAIAAHTAGASVVMAERGVVGGTCVNTGCIPSKALLAAARARRTALGDRHPSLATAAGPVDIGALMGAKRELVEALRTDKYIDLATEYGWEILHGEARFVPGPLLEISRSDGTRVRVEAENYLIASGARPSSPPIDGLAEAGSLTSTTAMDLTTLPESLVVVGGSASGLELAQLFGHLGTRVTVVESLTRLAPFEEPELSAAIEDAFTDEGIAVHTGTEITAVGRDASGYAIHAVRSGRRITLRAEELLITTGRRPASDGLGLDAVGVRTGERGEIVVDKSLRTHNPRIWAAGDVIGGPQYVYVAAAHGSLVAANALGGASRILDYSSLPRVTFTSPAIASVGLTNAQARAAGIACDCRALTLDQVPRALVERDTRGLIKLVADGDTGRLLGAHIVADTAGEVVAAATYALAAGLTVGQIASIWSPYLTMAEGLKLAAQTYERDISKLSCCAS